MFGYIADNEVRDEVYNAPIFLGEFAGVSDKSNYWLFIIKYLKEKHMSWGYWNINGKTKLVGDHKMHGVLDDTWNGINGGTWRINTL
jgi:hypothetical protein